ncbi:MAG: glycoside hydrolase [Acidobacteria bacterium]|nr:glycoside hydrolase [Acidobacteriota bacterium]
MRSVRFVVWSSVVVATALALISDLGATTQKSGAPPDRKSASPTAATAADSGPVADVPFAPGLFSEIRWRHIGPFRGGRTKALAGVPSQPNVFYIGPVNGGVWKTTDYGRTWVSMFDDQPTGSAGAIAVAPSNPNRIYVGSGEGMQRPDLSTGDGIYRSNDGGRSWTHLGLRDSQQIPQIIVDPRDQNRLFVAVLGHPYGPNEERGIFRSVDGGTTFQKVLYKDENTGGVDLAFDPTNSDTVYAVLWEARHGPWENAEWRGPGGGLFKSTDGGDTWKSLTKGLPTNAEGLGRIGITVAPSDPRRLYAVVEARQSGFYRSDDAGESWYRVCDDQRVVARPSDATDVRVHPRNPDIVFVPTIVTWKSTDGGKTFTGIRGAPGGDDYQRIWINPDNPDIMALTVDQGAVITVNGGATWSSWYTQPTAQMFHVNTDNDFPYRVCGGQQDSGSACVQTRGDDGQITFREWHPVGVEEYGYAVPDPLNANFVYGGKLTRYDRRTGQVQNVGPKPLRGDDYRTVRTAPVVFSQADPRVLFFASNTLWKTVNGGQSWAQVSGDLTRKSWEIPPNVGKYLAAAASAVSQRGVIYTIAPSPLRLGRIWVGTDDGLIHTTADGGLTWKDVTPPDLKPWAKVSIMDASHVDELTAYTAIDTMRLDDVRPHIYRTHNGGKTWTHITSGIPDGGIVRVVREDPKRKGLLFAGTEQAVYVSFDDGDHWRSLRLNMPATSVRDLVVKDDDLVVATHGRGFWILDDINPLRQISEQVMAADAHLFKPQDAWRFRWNKNTDTPLPPDEPAGQNPPDGAIINYFLKTAAAGPVTLEILDGAGKVVRKHSSDDVPEAPIEGRNIPDYWIRPPQVLSAAAGLHRFTWDVRLAPPAVSEFEYPISAIFRNTPREPRGPFVLPGVYTVRLTVAGRSFKQPLTVKMDPRVKTSLAGLQQQFTLSMQMYDGVRQTADVLQQAAVLRAQLNAAKEKMATGPVVAAFAVVEEKLAPLAGQATGQRGARGAGPVRRDLGRLNGEFALMFGLLQEADAAPPSQNVTAARGLTDALTPLLAQWEQIKKNDLPALNAKLKQAGLAEIVVR